MVKSYLNKHGWIRIVEAFVAILLLAGFLLTFLNKGYIEKEDISEKVFESEASILQEIQLDNSLRGEILNYNFGDEIPQNILDKVNSRKLDYLDCEIKICEIENLCEAEEIYQSIYAKEAIISASQTEFNPRKIKLFCWEK